MTSRAIDAKSTCTALTRIAVAREEVAETRTASIVRSEGAESNETSQGLGVFWGAFGGRNGERNFVTFDLVGASAAGCALLSQPPSASPRASLLLARYAARTHARAPAIVFPSGGCRLESICRLIIRLSDGPGSPLASL